MVQNAKILPFRGLLHVRPNVHQPLRHNPPLLPHRRPLDDQRRRRLNILHNRIGAHARLCRLSRHEFPTQQILRDIRKEESPLCWNSHLHSLPGCNCIPHCQFCMGYLRSFIFCGYFLFYQGASQSLVLATGINMISDVVGTKGKSGAFVFGIYSLLDKFSCGIAIFIIGNA